MRMEFEWDEIKSERTRRERGFGFDAAIGSSRVGSSVGDERRDWGEIRMVAVGVATVASAVVYTDRGDGGGSFRHGCLGIR